MTMYLDEVSKKKNFTPNVIIRMKETFFAIHEPDSGLVIPIQNRVLKNVTLNPAQVDLKKVTQTIASYSIRLQPTRAFTDLLRDDTTVLLNETVEIWIGRVGVNMDFSGYFKLIDTKVRAMDYQDGTFNIKTREAFDLMTKEVFNLQTNLAFDIDVVTTSFEGEFTGWPASGKIKIGKELMTYASRDDFNLYGVVRGVNSEANSHSNGDSIFFVWEFSGNPIDLLLQMLVSGGGGGVYDVLGVGLGISESMIDVQQFEKIRDDFFIVENYSIDVYNITDTLAELIEVEFLQSLNVRFNTTPQQKIGISILDQAEFTTTSKTIGERSISSAPKWEVNQSNVFNVIEMQWDFDAATEKYKSIRVFKDQESIDKYGESKPLKFKFKAIKSSQGGAGIVADRATRLLARFKTPTPTISFSTHLDKSAFAVGEKVFVTTSELPGPMGILSFASSLEIVSQSISHATGTVQYKLAFTSYSGIGNLAYIAPANSVVQVVNQSEIVLGVGLGDAWEVGYMVRLYNKQTNEFEKEMEVEEIREISEIDEDNIIFNSPFTTPIDPTKHILRFADYDETNVMQKAYCFIGQGGELTFADGASPYKITL